MSEEKNWIDPALDGSGGGFGRFKGLTVRELSQTFATIAEEGNMRSVTGILRMSREQLEGRSHLAVSTQAASVLGAVTVLLAVAMLFETPQIRVLLVKGVGISGILFVGFLAGALSTRKLTKAAVAQDRAICGIAIEALTIVLNSPNFKPKPLDSVQRQTLKQLLKKSSTDHPGLKELLVLE